MRDSSAPPPSYGPGHMLAAKYRLEHKLGEGAMAEVWAARNITLDLPVALKLIRRRSRNPALIDRLLREAQAVAKMTHPAAVRVFDFGATERGDPYIVMERLEGRDLRQLLTERGPLSPEDAVAIMLPVAAAIHAAHARGIVHRDLKPDNVFLARDDGKLQPKVLDFGVAKLEWLDDDPDAGRVVGTPEYMPPEQALGALDADHRSDVWGFCAVLYELIAGESPFKSTGALDAMRAALQDDVPSLADAGLCDARLWAIIERGLRKEPSERWASVEDLGGRLASWLAQRGVNEDVTGASLPAGWGVASAAPPPSESYERSSEDSAFGIDSRPLPPPGQRARAIGAAVVGVGTVALALAWMSLPDAPTTETESAAASPRVASVPAQSASAPTTAAVATSAAATPPPPPEPPPAVPPAATAAPRGKTAAAEPARPAPPRSAPRPARPGKAKAGAPATPEEPNPAALPAEETPAPAEAHPAELPPPDPAPPPAAPPAAPPPAAVDPAE